jgi:hypothetical protein
MTSTLYMTERTGEALGNSQVDGFDVAHEVIDFDGGLPICKERLYLLDDGEGEPGIPENSDEALVVNVVKEALYVNGQY